MLLLFTICVLLAITVVSSDLSLCDHNIVNRLNAPHATKSDHHWCKWATKSGEGNGNVAPGRSWGKLKSLEDRKRFADAGCSLIVAGIEPTCDGLQGDWVVKRWRSRNADTGRCNQRAVCVISTSNQEQCYFKGAQLQFGEIATIVSPKGYVRRTFNRGFISLECPVEDIPTEYSYLLGQTLDPACDETIADDVLIFSPDEILNIGHTMADFMNLFASMWLTKLGEDPKKKVSVLIIDGLDQKHRVRSDESKFGFYRHLEVAFNKVYRASAFMGLNSTVCIPGKLITPLYPLLPTMWEGRMFDLNCTTIGPSSLFQRYNLHVRRAYGMPDTQPYQFSDDGIPLLKVLILQRDGGANQLHREHGRMFNKDVMVKLLRGIAKMDKNVAAAAIDLGSLPSLDAQMALLHSANIVVGYHGAAIAMAMHMPIGSRFCCGMIEIYPDDYYKSYKFYGNSARKMGFRYHRIDSSGLPILERLLRLINSTVAEIRTNGLKQGTSSCVHPDVAKDPYFKM